MLFTATRRLCCMWHEASEEKEDDGVDDFCLDQDCRWEFYAILFFTRQEVNKKSEENISTTTSTVSEHIDLPLF